MQEQNSEPGQASQPDRPCRRLKNREYTRSFRVRVTPVHVAGFVLVLALLLISIATSLAGISYAHASSPRVPLDTPTAVDTTTPSPTPTNTPTSTPTNTPTPTPTKAPTKTPTPRPTAPPAAPTANATATAGASPTATATAVAPVQTPAITPTGAPPTTIGNTTGTSTPARTSGSGEGMRVMLIIAGASVLLLLCLGVGWFFFRRMLLPQAGSKLPPSGARPWSRTRAPNPDSSLNGISTLNMDEFNRNVVQASNPLDNQYAPVPNGFNQAAAAGFAPPNNGYAPNMPPGNGFARNMPPNNGYAPDMQSYGGANPGFPVPAPNGYTPQGMNGYASPANGFGGGADGFIPPSPQIFPSSEASMIPPGSGAFPVVNGNGGFAPASSAFSAMYGLPGDPFAASQAGSPGWLENLSSGSGPGQETPPPASGFVPNPVDLSDPSLAEVIRQYSQKGGAAPPQQPSQSEMHPGFQNPDWLK